MADILSALGQSTLAQNIRNIRESAERMRKQPQEDALNEMAMKEARLKLNTLETEAQRKIVEEQRKEAELEAVRPVDSLLSGKGLTPGVQNFLLQVGEQNKWFKDIGGVKVISNRNLQSAKSFLTENLSMQKQLDELTVADLSGQIAELQTALNNPDSKLKPQDVQKIQVKIQALDKQRTAALNTINALDPKIREITEQTKGKLEREKIETEGMIEAARIRAAAKKQTVSKASLAWELVENGDAPDILTAWRMLGAKGRPPSEKTILNLSAAQASIDRLKTLDETFKDEFSSGDLAVLGDFGLKVDKYLGKNLERADWWADFHSLKNIDRHELFGAALTKYEQDQWDKTVAQTTQDPEAVKRNVKQLLRLAVKAIKTKKDALRAAGVDLNAFAFERGAVDEAVAEPTGEQVAGTGPATVPPATGKILEKGSKEAQAILQEAGGDPTRAAEIAKKRGFIVPASTRR